MDTVGLIPRLFAWTENSNEPLRSYATGVLACALEMPDVTTDPDHKETINRMVKAVIPRLREFQKQFKEEREKNHAAFKRPFAMFGSSQSGAPPAKSPRRSSRDQFPDHLHPGGDGDSLEVAPHSPGKASSIGDFSNSSWAEMESQIIGHFQTHPLTLQAQQIFIIRLLTPLAEYQEFVSVIIDENLISLVIPYIKVKETKDARLAFEALKLLAAMFCHKKAVMEFVTTHKGVQILLDVPRPSIAATAVCQVLYYIVCDSDSMEKV